MVCHYEVSRIMTLRLCRGRTTLGVGGGTRKWVRVFRLVMCVTAYVCGVKSALFLPLQVSSSSRTSERAEVARAATQGL